MRVCVCVFQVLESCDGKQPDEVTIEVSHDVASTDTDSGMSGEYRYRLPHLLISPIHGGRI